MYLAHGSPADSFFNVQPPVTDEVLRLQNDFIDGVIVVEFNKAKPTFLVGASFNHLQKNDKDG